MKVIPVDLYFCSPNTMERFMKPKSCFIYKRVIHYQEVEFENKDDKTPFSNYEEKEEFKFFLDNTYSNLYKNIKPNCRFDIGKSNIESDGVIGGYSLYAKLGRLDIYRLQWIFKKTWLQKSENVKWIISMFLSAIAIGIALLK